MNFVDGGMERVSPVVLASPKETLTAYLLCYKETQKETGIFYHEIL